MGGGDSGSMSTEYWEEKDKLKKDTGMTEGEAVLEILKRREQKEKDARNKKAASASRIRCRPDLI